MRLSLVALLAASALACRSAPPKAEPREGGTVATLEFESNDAAAFTSSPSAAPTPTTPATVDSGAKADLGPRGVRAVEALVAFGRDRNGPPIARGTATRRFCLQGFEVFLVERLETDGLINYASGIYIATAGAIIRLAP